MTLFRPCIDLHGGQVKQLVGGTLTDDENGLKTNFVAEGSAADYAALYRRDGLTGAHIILLGPGNDAAAQAALAAWPDGLQLGGGVTPLNARAWLGLGAARVIVTSYLFEGPLFSWHRLDELLQVLAPSELVIDLSCRRLPSGEYRVATNRWQTVTEQCVDARLLERLGGRCSEFLVHAADVEGLCQGIDEELVELLGEHCPVPCTYAGGGRDLADLERVERLSEGRVDLTFGSALDLFGGRSVRYADCVAFNRSRGQRPSP